MLSDHDIRLSNEREPAIATAEQRKRARITYWKARSPKKNDERNADWKSTCETSVPC